jgi:hypothetical protein
MSEAITIIAIPLVLYDKLPSIPEEDDILNNQPKSSALVFGLEVNITISNTITKTNAIIAHCNLISFLFKINVVTNEQQANPANTIAVIAAPDSTKLVAGMKSLICKV